MARTVRIDIRLFLEMYAYICHHPNHSDPSFHTIREAARKKIQAMIRHEEYNIALRDAKEPHH